MKSGGYRSTSAKNKAIIVVAHAILIIVWHVLATGTPYQELGATTSTAAWTPKRNPPPHRQTRSPRTPGHPRRRRLTPPAREADGTKRRRLAARAWLGTIHVSAGSGPSVPGRELLPCYAGRSTFV